MEAPIFHSLAPEQPTDELQGSGRGPLHHNHMPYSFPQHQYQIILLGNKSTSMTIDNHVAEFMLGTKNARAQPSNNESRRSVLAMDVKNVFLLFLSKTHL